MKTKTPKISNLEITEPKFYQSRRRFIQSSTAGLGLALLGGIDQSSFAAGKPSWLSGKDAQKSPLSTNEKVTGYKEITSYNNFYEFGATKTDPMKHSGQFKPLPWSIEVSGECAKPGRYLLEDFIKPHTLEERIYRLRCVEAWSMVIPWLGIPLGVILKRFEPNSRAKYVAFTTLFRPDEMPGQKTSILKWPYVEGLRLDEAMHPLTILAVGLYGEMLPNQNGAPLRLIVPWKYGFKSIKSIVKISFMETEPRTTWNMKNSREYGFYSNVNPMVDHPRWSQAKERRIGEFFKRRTLPFNGYAEQVAHLYGDMDLMKRF